MSCGKLVERGAIAILGAGNETLVIVSDAHHRTGCERCRYRHRA